MGKIFPLLFIMYICSLFNAWEHSENSTEGYVICSIFKSSSYANNINLFLIIKCKIFIIDIVFLLENICKYAYYYLQISFWSYMELNPWLWRLHYLTIFFNNNINPVCRFHDNYYRNLLIIQLI